jgi:hypothetical protein
MLRIEVTAAICMPLGTAPVWRFFPKFIPFRLPRSVGIADFGFPVQEIEFSERAELTVFHDSIQTIPSGRVF